MMNICGRKLEMLSLITMRQNWSRACMSSIQSCLWMMRKMKAMMVKRNLAMKPKAQFQAMKADQEVNEPNIHNWYAAVAS